MYLFVDEVLPIVAYRHTVDEAEASRLYRRVHDDGSVAKLGAVPERVPQVPVCKHNSERVTDECARTRTTTDRLALTLAPQHCCDSRLGDSALVR